VRKVKLGALCWLLQKNTWRICKLNMAAVSSESMPLQHLAPLGRLSGVCVLKNSFFILNVVLLWLYSMHGHSMHCFASFKRPSDLNQKMRWPASKCLFTTILQNEIGIEYYYCVRWVSSSAATLMEACFDVSWRTIRDYDFDPLIKNCVSYAIVTINMINVAIWRGKLKYS